MAYVKTIWQTGDVITAEKLNNMEGGIEAAGPVVVDFVKTADGISASMTLEEMAEALSAGSPLFAHLVDQVSDNDLGISPMITKCSGGINDTLFVNGGMAFFGNTLYYEDPDLYCLWYDTDHTKWDLNEIILSTSVPE